MNIIDPAFTINIIRQNPPNYSMKMKNYYTIIERKFSKKVLIPFTQSI